MTSAARLPLVESCLKLLGGWSYKACIEFLLKGCSETQLCVCVYNVYVRVHKRIYKYMYTVYTNASALM